MKYCSKCGTELFDEAVVCPKCGCPTELYKQEMNTEIQEKPKEISGLKKTAKVFMIIGCVFSALCWLIPLAWAIPMTVSYCKKIKRHETVSVGFKVCSLLFVSQIGGILMLCDKD